VTRGWLLPPCRKGGATDYIKKPIRLRELRASVAGVEERHALEATILSGLEREPERPAISLDSRTLKELKHFHQELEALGQLWEAVRPHLAVSSEGDGEQRILDFAMDEIPSTLARMRQRLDDLIRAQDETKAFADSP
jgi:DNA-binding response OmpR family regulator